MDSNKKRAIKKFFIKPKNMFIASLAIIVIIGFFISAYFIFISGSLCEDDLCFSQKLVKCKKASYIDSNLETVKEYNILGKKDGKCEIEITVLQIKKGSIGLASLEDKSMTCSVPIGTNNNPESNIKFCHGLLKEGIQELIIQRMHAEIIENLGQIEEGLTQVI